MQGGVPGSPGWPLSRAGQAACADSDISEPGLGAQRLIESSCSSWRAAPRAGGPWLSLG